MYLGMMDMRRPTVVLGVALVLLAPSLLLSQTGERVALVIGNGTYQYAHLEHPPQEAAAMARALQECGFRVIKRINCTHQEMKEAIREFGGEISRGGVGLFYYGGHGVQVAGRNYLIPVDADIQGEEEVEFGAVDAGLVLAKMESAGNRANIVILDACRDNPYQSSFKSSTRGLRKMDAPTGTLLAYSTGPGEVAVDGVYTPILIQYMTTPGLPILQVFMNVRQAVMGATGDSQVPWESTSLTEDLCFLSGITAQTDTTHYPDGSKYIGEFGGGKYNGQGTYYFADGLKYVGEFKNGHYSGQGTYYHASGSRYVGEHRDGELNGQGTFYYANGDKYVGEWKDGKRHGQGTLHYVDGRVDKGRWANDNFVGE